MADPTINATEPELVITEATTIDEVMRYLAATQPDLLPQEAITLAYRMLNGEQNPEIEAATSEELAAAQNAAFDVAEKLAETQGDFTQLDEDERAIAEENKADIEEFAAILGMVNTSALGWAGNYMIGFHTDLLDEDIERMYGILEAFEFVPSNLAISPDLTPENRASMMKAAVYSVLAQESHDSVFAMGVWAAEQEGVNFTGAHEINMGGSNIPVPDVNRWAQAYANGNTTEVLKWVQVADYAGVPLDQYVHLMSLRDLVPASAEGAVPEQIDEVRRFASEQYEIAQRLKDGNELYSSPLLSMIYAVDPELAERLKSGEPLTVEETRMLKEIIGADDTLLRQIDNMRLPELDHVMDLMTGETTQLTYDETAVLEAARTIAQSWNLDFDDAELLGLTKTWKDGQQETFNQRSPFLETEDRVNTFGEGGQSDGNLAMRETIRNTPDYQRFFSNKPGSQTEETYVSRFQNQSSRIFGDLVPEAIQAGMETGDINAVGQAGIYSGAAEESSQFLGGLARLSQSLRKLT